jgi:hypothetical protein
VKKVEKANKVKKAAQVLLASLYSPFLQVEPVPMGGD